MAKEPQTEPRAGTLDRLAEIIGEELALRLSIHFGGMQLYIPLTPQADSDLVKVIGEIGAQQLARRMGGTFVTVPAGPGKRARIVELRSGGRKVHEIADLIGCTERYVYQVMQEYQAERGPLKRMRQPKRVKRRRTLGKTRGRNVAPSDQRSLFDED